MLRNDGLIPGVNRDALRAFAAALATALQGLANRTEPPECFIGDSYSSRHLPRVPYTLAEATEKFAASEFAKRAFGEDAVEHYTHFFRTEQAAFNVAVTDWERRRYF